MNGSKRATRRLGDSATRRRSLVFSAAASLIFVVSAGGPAFAQDDGHDALRSGKYQEAIALLAKVPASDSDWMNAQKDLVRAYATTGKYDEAENVARRATVAKNGVAMWNTFGEVLLLRGKRAAAESAFVRAAPGPDSLDAALNLAILHYDRGERDRAMKEFDRFIDVYNKSGGSALNSEELVAVARAVEYLGANDPQLFKDALKAYDRAISEDPNNLIRHSSASTLWS